jgi:DNA-binding transcriptional ArsR family regulator
MRPLLAQMANNTKVSRRHASGRSFDTNRGLMTMLNDVGAALADETRMLVLDVAARGASTPSEIAAVSGYAPSTVAHHLAKLERAGLVERRRRGRQHLVFVRHDRLRLLLGAIDAIERTHY